MYLARIAAALFIVVAACGTSQTSRDGGTDGGGGVCCPITGPPPGCDCVYGGGWAESVDKCPKGGICDGWTEATDSHGCIVPVADPSKFSQCPPLKDSGADASVEAATDGASDGASE